MKRKIYLAGGWFSPEQEEEHSRIYELLKDDYDVFNPKLESFVTPDAKEDMMTLTLLGNLRAIKDADLVVAITDRKDMGTIWECGYAYSIQKPIIYYAETLGQNPFNLMLAKTGTVALNEIQLLERLGNGSWTFQEIHNDYAGDIE